MFRLLLWLLLAYIGYRVLKKILEPRRPLSGKPVSGYEETVQDPVCKMYLSKNEAVVGTVDGKRYYFCSMDCLEKYREQIENNHKF